MLGNSRGARPLALLAVLDRAAELPRLSRFSRLARALRERTRLASARTRSSVASEASGLESLVTCDGDSDLGNLAIVANSSQVCRVPLLMGAEYAVHADAPLADIAASDENAEIVYYDSPAALMNGAPQLRAGRPRLLAQGGGPSASFSVRSPLEFSFEPDGNGGYALSTSPRYVGAVLTNLVGGCCSPVLSANGFRWTCAADCGCSGGEHAFEVYVTYEGYMLFQWWEGWCACRDEGDVTEAGRLSLNLPDTLFENTDCDVVQDGFNSDFGSQIVWGEDDLGRGRLRLATGTGGGTLRYVGTSGFVGDVYEGDEADDVLANGTEWALQSGVGLFKGFWLDAGAVSPHYRRGRVTASWTPEGGAASTVTKRFTVVRPVAEPICTETKSVEVDGETHDSVYNPCGVGVGKDAYFKIAVTPADYPDEKIVWTSTVPGAVAFVGGSTGREVRVRGLAPGWTRLSVQIGESPSEPPQFPLKVVTNRVLHLTAWIVRDTEEGEVRTEGEVRAMLPTVNDIFAQIGLTVVLDGVNVMANNNAYNLYYYATNVVDSKLSIDNLLDSLPNTDCVNCVFANKFVEEEEKDTLAVHTPSGIVMTKRANALVLAHEIGHELGAGDIYASEAADDGQSIDVINVGFRYTHAPDDWSNGCINDGPGYYGRDMTCDKIIKRMLMNGRGVSGRDLTAGEVFGVKKRADGSLVRDNAPTGFFK